MPRLVSQRQGLRNVATAHLAQTMALIELPADDLEASVAAELAANPALELASDNHCPRCGRRVKQHPCPACYRDQFPSEGPIVYLSARKYATGSGVFDYTERDGDGGDTLDVREPEKLPEHILRQIAVGLAHEDRHIAAYLLNRLDKHGFLPESPADSALFLHVSLPRVNAVLGLIQRAEPPGLGTQDARESLLVQLEVLEEDTVVHPLARVCIDRHWAALCRRDWGRVARDLRVPRAAITDALAYIRRNLTPYPAQAFSGDGRGPFGPASGEGGYYRPDAIISRPADGSDKPLNIEVFTPVDGTLRVEPTFKAALDECADGSAEREEWRRHMARAQLFAKCLQQRNNTMCRLLSEIALEQDRFILGGDGDLKPLTRSAMAGRLGVHESTISRAVADKSVALPGGRIVPLAKFFDRSLSARDAVKAIIGCEDRPLTDDEIAAHLRLRGYGVARRTVAKYRAAEGILSAAARARVRDYSRVARRPRLTARAETGGPLSGPSSAPGQGGRLQAEASPEPGAAGGVLVGLQ